MSDTKLYLERWVSNLMWAAKNPADGLDRKVGIHEDKLIEAHGSFGAGHCIDCQAAYTEEQIRKELSPIPITHRPTRPLTVRSELGYP